MNRKLNILLVENRKKDIVLFEKALQKAKLERKVNLIILTKGKEAIDYILGLEKTKNKNPIPNLIILDLNLPITDGFEVLKTIKSNKKTKDIPITVFSCSTLKQDIEQSLKLGADRYEVKPLSFKDFTEKIKEVIIFFRNLNKKNINRENQMG